MSKETPNRESLLLNLVCNIALPTLVLTKLSGENRLGPTWGMVVALAFPFGWILLFLPRTRRPLLVAAAVYGVLTALAVGGPAGASMPAQSSRQPSESS